MKSKEVIQEFVALDVAVATSFITGSFLCVQAILAYTAKGDTDSPVVRSLNSCSKGRGFESTLKPVT